MKLIGLTFEERDEQIPYHMLKLRGAMEDGGLQIGTGILETDNGHIRLQTARIGLPIAERTLVDSPLAANLQVDLPNIEILSQIFALPALGGSIQDIVDQRGLPRAGDPRDDRERP